MKKYDNNDDGSLIEVARLDKKDIQTRNTCEGFIIPTVSLEPPYLPYCLPAPKITYI
jgi:hypothetical protein